MSNLDWAWKDPDKKDTKPTNKTELTFGKSARKKRKKAKRVFTKNTGNDFYISKEWRTLRYRVIKSYSGECMACGRSKKEHGVVIHVDHIKPRSTHPSLSLVFENLQLLCQDCNEGKGNKCQIDWRPSNV